jgi:hypothetical protein
LPHRQDHARRGSRLSLACSCDGRVVDWALTLWGDRLYAVRLLGKGSRCAIERHRSGRQISVRARQRHGRRTYYDVLA